MHVSDLNLPECIDDSMKRSKSSKYSNKRKSKKIKSDDFDFSEFDEFIKAPVFSLSNQIDENSKLASIIPEPTEYFKNDKMKLSFFSSFVMERNLVF